jgi:hypothetical protein
MTRPGEVQVGRRAPANGAPRGPSPRQDRWLHTTESGLQACYGEAPLRRGFSISPFARDSSRLRLTGVPNGGARLTVTAGLGHEHAATGPG